MQIRNEIFEFRRIDWQQYEALRSQLSSSDMTASQSATLSVGEDSLQAYMINQHNKFQQQWNQMIEDDTREMGQ